jgi:hypothetical protein
LATASDCVIDLAGAQSFDPACEAVILALPQKSMQYSLGSFPQYGYQARNAAIRRQIAQENSAATLRAKAQRELMIEESVYRYLEQHVITMSPLAEQ